MHNASSLRWKPQNTELPFLSVYWAIPLSLATSRTKQKGRGCAFVCLIEPPVLFHWGFRASLDTPPFFNPPASAPYSPLLLLFSNQIPYVCFFIYIRGPGGGVGLGWGLGLRWWGLALGQSLLCCVGGGGWWRGGTGSIPFKWLEPTIDKTRKTEHSWYHMEAAHNRITFPTSPPPTPPFSGLKDTITTLKSAPKRKGVSGGAEVTEFRRCF